MYKGRACRRAWDARPARARRWGLCRAVPRPGRVGGVVSRHAPPAFPFPLPPPGALSVFIYFCTRCVRACGHRVSVACVSRGGARPRRVLCRYACYVCNCPRRLGMVSDVVEKVCNHPRKGRHGLLTHYRTAACRNTRVRSRSWALSAGWLHTGLPHLGTVVAQRRVPDMVSDSIIKTWIHVHGFRHAT